VNRPRLLLAFLLLGAPSVVMAQPLPELTLEELMRMDAGRVFGASERPQPVIEAPASVSFITAEEIARYGYRTLADILQSVRGMYVTDDRNFSLLGTRGFAKPGDYNSRILLLVNGHRVNDNVFGQAEIGAEFGLDPAMFERVEIIRGPASSQYGDSAFFAVVNVITRSGAALDGVSIGVSAGTLDTVMTRASAGRRFANGVDLALSGTYEQSAGVESLYFPAFDTPATNRGIAEGLDGMRLSQFYGQVRFKDFAFTGAYGRRRKDVPTASFGTAFNEQGSRESTTDRHTLADFEYGRGAAGGHFVVRGSFDQFSFTGLFPNAAPEAESSVVVAESIVLGTRWTAATRFTRTLPGRQTLTAGGEIIDNVHQDQNTQYLNPTVLVFAEPRSSVQSALYLQDELKVKRWLIVNAGLRYDRYEDFVRITPRTAVILMPSSNESVKYLYGRAFRAPNLFERNTFYFGATVNELRPESIDTHELVWERYTHDWLRTSISTYWYNADRLVTSIATDDPSSLLGTAYVNGGHVRARGLELEAQARLGHGVQGLVSYALQSAKEVDSGATLVNSPRQMAKARVSMRALSKGSTFGLELLAIGRRQTLAGFTLNPAVTMNATLIAPVGRSFELVGNVRNLFNAHYADPGSDSHLQDVIPQNGVTLRVGLTWKIPAK
jgi:outer membrane receptor for ferrienterochelin and colicins